MFKKYQHVQRFGTEEVEGINYGMCYIFSKIDGTNGSLWFDGENIQAGSRNKLLSEGADNQGFLNAINKDERIPKFFVKYPNLRLYGEWLKPHTLKDYEDDAWGKFYVFDVMDEDDKYLYYEKYKVLLEEFGIEYIPPICKVENPTPERLINQLDKATFLIKDGFKGEGVVIKNYDFVNKFGRTTWAKIVRNEFKTSHRKAPKVTEIKEKKDIESQIILEYVTESLINKEFDKIRNEESNNSSAGYFNSKDIPKLLNVVFYCLVNEEMWNIIKKYKNPLINFTRLKGFVIERIKEVKSDLF